MMVWRLRHTFTHYIVSEELENKQTNKQETMSRNECKYSAFYVTSISLTLRYSSTKKLYIYCIRWRIVAEQLNMVQGERGKEKEGETGEVDEAHLHLHTTSWVLGDLQGMAADILKNCAAIVQLLGGSLRESTSHHNFSIHGDMLTLC